MVNLAKAPIILEKALAEWRKKQTLRKEKTSVSEFANFIEYSQTTVSLWLNGDREITEKALLEILPKLIELLGEDICDELEIPRPDVLYGYVSENWNEAPIEERKRIAKIIEKYSNKPIPNGKEAKHTPKP
jgi:transcriptional regulator with XRE-family HTH domain